MTRRPIGFLVTLTLAILVAPLAAEAQPPKHVPRIGLLITNSRAAESTSIEAFRRGLQALGYVEGQNISLEYRFADGNLEQLPPFALVADALSPYHAMLSLIREVKGLLQDPVGLNKSTKTATGFLRSG
jgi:hypothetical protein